MFAEHHISVARSNIDRLPLNNWIFLYLYVAGLWEKSVFSTVLSAIGKRWNQINSTSSLCTFSVDKYLWSPFSCSTKRSIKFLLFFLNSDIKHKALSGNTICILLILLQRGTSTLSMNVITHQVCQPEAFAGDLWVAVSSFVVFTITFRPLEWLSEDLDNERLCW